MYIDITKIEIDTELYPRNQMNWMQALSYKKAMEVGAQFPPIVVGKRGHQFIVIDGVHRLDAWRKLGEKQVPALITQTEEKDWLLESVALNVKNGLTLSPQERIKNAVRLQEQGYSDEAISKAVCIQVTDLKRFIAERTSIRAADQTCVIRKSIVKDRESIREENDQKTLHSRSVGGVIHECIYLFENNLIDDDDEELVNSIVHLSELLEGFLSKTKSLA